MSVAKVPVLGGWIANMRRVPEGSVLVRLDEPFGDGDRARVTVDFDVDLSPGSAVYVNRLVQAALDGAAAGCFEITGHELIRFQAPKRERKDGPKGSNR